MIREILRLFHSSGLSIHKISKATGASRGAVTDYIQRAKAANLTWPLPAEFDDETKLEQRLFPLKTKQKNARPQPDCNYMHQELRKKGVTRIQLWTEYLEEHPDGYSQSQFCDIYNRWAANVDISMRQEHKAGEKAFSDFAGTTFPITNPHTGEIRQAHLFVCTMGASSYTFAKLFESENTEAWCTGHSDAFSYFGGVPEIVVPDNPKPVVTKANRYEPDINPSFSHMANHYEVAVIPARVRKPKDKAVVEAAVGVATRWILAVLRKQTFFSLPEANNAVALLLEKLNEKPFKKLPGSRKSKFEAIDKPALKPLPKVPFEFAHIKKVKVHIDYHIEYDGLFYSVPYQYRGESVEVRATFGTIEIYRDGNRIASHARGFIKGKAFTLRDHMPKGHRQLLDWTPERITCWAQKIGPSTAELIQTILAKYKYPQQGFRSCLGILNFEKSYGKERLESACQHALTIRSSSYKSIKSILDTGLDKRPLREKPLQLKIVHSNIRGAISFQSTNKGEEQC